MRNFVSSVVASVLVLTLAACGDKGDPVDAGAKGGPADTAGGLGAAPPKASNPSSAGGRWTADLGPMKEMMRPFLEMAKSMASMATGDDKAAAEKSLAEANAKLAELDKARFVLDLFPDGRAVMDMAGLGEAPEKSTGTWKQSGQDVTITLVTKNGKPYDGPPDEQSKTLVHKGDTLSLTDAAMPFALVFKR